jgi:hypothetical protein
MGTTQGADAPDDHPSSGAPDDATDAGAA